MKAKFVIAIGWLVFAVNFALLLVSSPAHSQSSGSAEWERIVAAAKKEGKLVAGIPASADLRKQIEATFKAKFPGIELELMPSRGRAERKKDRRRI